MKKKICLLNNKNKVKQNTPANNGPARFFIELINLYSGFTFLIFEIWRTFPTRKAIEDAAARPIIPKRNPNKQFNNILVIDDIIE